MRLPRTTLPKLNAQPRGLAPFIEIEGIASSGVRVSDANLNATLLDASRRQPLQPEHNARFCCEPNEVRQGAKRPFDSGN